MQNKIGQLSYVLLFVLILLFLVSPTIFVKISNGDLWKNLVIGRYISLFAKLPDPSVFTYFPTEFNPKNSYTWLGNVTLFKIYSLGGFTALNALKLLPILIIVTLVFIQTGLKPNFWLIFPLAIYVYGIAPRNLIGTPLISLTMMPVLTFLWCRFRLFNSNKLLWFIPPLFVLWANFHGSYLIGGFIFSGFFLGLLIDYFLKRKINSRCLFKTGSILLIASISIIFFKPYVDQLPLKILNISTTKTTNTELKSTTINPKDARSINKYQTDSKLLKLLQVYTHDFFRQERPYVSPEFTFSLAHIHRIDQIIAFFVILPAWLLGLFLVGGKYDYSLIFGFLFSLWIGISFKRALPFPVIVGFISLAMLFSKYGLNKYIMKSIKKYHKTLFKISLYIVLFIGAGYISYGLLQSNPGNYFLLSDPLYERGFGKIELYNEIPTRLLLANHSDKRIFSNNTLGSLMLFSMWPYKKVGFWSRNSSFKKNFIRKYLIENNRRKIIQKYEVHLIVTPVWNRDFIRYLKKNSDWNLLHSTNFVNVYCKCPEKSDMKIGISKNPNLNTVI